MGNDSKSDGGLFYVPQTKSLIGSADYAIDHIPPAGAVFNLDYDGHIDFSVLSPSTPNEQPPPFHENHKVFAPDDKETLQPATIVTIPFDESGSYTIQYKHDSQIVPIKAENIKTLNPSTNIRSHLPAQWIVSEAKATCCLDTMTSPKQGKLFKSQDDWFFVPGRNLDMTKKIPIPNFEDKIENLLSQQKIQPWWISISNATEN